MRLLTKQIARIAAEESGYPYREIMGQDPVLKTRGTDCANLVRRIRQVRQLVMWVAWGRGASGRSLESIAQAFKRDKKAVVYGIRQTQKRLDQGETELQALKARIEAKMAAWVPPPPVMVWAKPAQRLQPEAATISNFSEGT